jgi:ABC-type branched-subunit amino acid transport system ATPase component
METLRCEGLSKSFEGIRALDKFTLDLASPGIVAIIGPNGAGKTTLFNILTGFLRPDSGNCFFGKYNLTRLPPYQIAALGIVRTFQDLRLIMHSTVLDNVLLSFPHQGGEHFLRALLRYGVAIEENRNRIQGEQILRFVELEEKATEIARDLSYGQQKLLSLACCLATRPSILLLDEPIAGVHPNMADRILQRLRMLRDERKLVVFIEHDISFVREIADSVVVMSQGKVIAQGNPEEVLKRREVVEAYLA